MTTRPDETPPAEPQASNAAESVTASATPESDAKSSAAATIEGAPATEPDPSAGAAVAVPAAPRQGSRLSRFIEWFWAGRALRSVLQQSLVGKRATELVTRSRAAVELGEAALDPPQPYDHGPMDAHACELFRQSIHWSLASLQARGTGDSVQGPSDLVELWQRADPSVLAHAAGDATLATGIHAAIAGKSFVDFAELPRDEQARLARVLGAFAKALCNESDLPRREIERIWHGRLLRVGVLAGLIVTIVAAVHFGRERAETARDLARGKPWTASSKYPEGGCTSPNQTCPGESRYFFSTAEQDNPWLELDLQTPQRFSGVRIVNRLDCCPDRAVPLVVEVSSDHKKWNEVAKRSDEFSDWKARFPAVEARWVRVRVPRRTHLHLTSVRVLP